MKNSIFSYILLLIFSLIVLHNIVPHHHHDIYSFSGEQQFGHQSRDQQSQAHSHHDHDHHSHSHAEEPVNNKPTSHGNNPDFPQHSHFFAAGDFEYTRVNHENHSIKYIQLSSVVVTTLLTDYTVETPGLTYRVLKFPWLIHNDFDPAIFLLRAPPFYA